ncbi:YihY/virulence factor BrkB family protein, partial [Streptomyces sp. NPDC058320]
AAPVGVILWLGLGGCGVLAGAGVTAALDRVWPSVATSVARAANERWRTKQAAEYVARSAAREAHGGIDDADDPDMPSEFPERWSKFLPPDDVSSRLRAHVRKNGDHAQGPNPRDHDDHDHN